MYLPPPQVGRRVLITGANSGIGLQTTKRLAAAGAEVIMAVRNLNRGERAVAAVRAEVPNARVELRQLDLASLGSVREFATAMLEAGEPLDTLINNAGVMNPPERLTTQDGFELQFGTNFLGPFLLTTMLLPVLVAAPRPRVVTVTSVVAARGSIAFHDLNSERSYRPMRAYAQSKLADYLLGLRLGELSDERGWGLISVLAHPGVTRTDLFRSGPSLGGRRSAPWYYSLTPGMDVREGSEPIIMAATDPKARQGACYGPRFLVKGEAQVVPAPKSVHRSDSVRLWEFAIDLTGLPRDRPLV